MNKTVMLLPVYNAEKFLRECLDGVVNQTCPDFRMIVCNDGSKDGGLDILREYAAKDHRITVLNNPGNLGIVATRNRLLKAIPEDAEFVAWIDADARYLIEDGSTGERSEMSGAELQDLSVTLETAPAGKLIFFKRIG